MQEELARYGYRISPGTLYPLLHGLEQKGYLPTPKGRQALRAPRGKISELFTEIVGGE